MSLFVVKFVDVIQYFFHKDIIIIFEYRLWLVREALVGTEGSGWYGRLWLVRKVLVGTGGSGWYGRFWLVRETLVGTGGSGWYGSPLVPLHNASLFIYQAFKILNTSLKLEAPQK